MSPISLERIALWWGPGVLLMIVFGVGFMRLAQYWIGKTMEAKQYQLDSALGIARQYIEQFVSAQKSQAEALSRVATTAEERESTESFEHQEMLIAIKTLHRDISALLRKTDGSASQ